MTTKFTARYLKPEGFWEVRQDKSRTWYTASKVSEDEWYITNGRTWGVVSSTGKLGRSIIAAIMDTIHEQTSAALADLKARGIEPEMTADEVLKLTRE